MAGRSVLSIERGSNANGKWQKYYNSGGDLVCVSQHGNTSGTHGTEITLPISMPDTGFVPVATGQNWGQMLAIVEPLSVTKFQVYIAAHNGVNGGAQLIRWHAEWFL